MASYLEDLQQVIRDVGVPFAAEASGLSTKHVETFLRAPGDTHISTLALLARGMNMPIGEFHLVDRATGHCHTCRARRDVNHYALFPDDVAS